MKSQVCDELIELSMDYVGEMAGTYSTKKKEREEILITGNVKIRTCGISQWNPEVSHLCVFHCHKQRRIYFM